MKEDDATLKAELRALSALREDAGERGLPDLVVAYGLSCIRICAELLERQTRAMLRDQGLSP